MDKLLYVAMAGAKQIMHQQTTNNHNLANANTTGFKADYDAFAQLPMTGPGHDSRVYTQDRRAGVNLQAGSILQTGRDLDVAIQSEGYFAVETATGGEAYTRAGDFRINASGLLETRTGELVLGNGGPVAIPPYEQLLIGSDGTISVQPVGQEASALAVLDRLKLVNPSAAQLTKGADGLLVSRDGETFGADAEVRVTSGALEASNVNMVDGLVNMIQLSRQYEMNISMMKKAEEMDEASASLMRIT